MPTPDPMDELDRELFGESTPASRARSILTNAVPMAAATLVDLASNGTSERTRLSAADAILNRVLGPVGKDEAQDTLADFLKSIEHIAQGDRQEK